GSRRTEAPMTAGERGDLGKEAAEAVASPDCGNSTISNFGLNTRKLNPAPASDGSQRTGTTDAHGCTRMGPGWSGRAAHLWRCRFTNDLARSSSICVHRCASVVPNTLVQPPRSLVVAPIQLRRKPASGCAAFSRASKPTACCSGNVADDAPARTMTGARPAGSPHQTACSRPTATTAGAASVLQFAVPIQIVAPALVQIVGREHPALVLQLPRRRLPRMAARAHRALLR